MNELLRLAQSVADRATAGEQIEAYVSQGTEASVSVYEGKVEKLISAQSAGIGIRVIRDGRVGFAYAGVLDADSVAEVLAEARDNVTFGTPDPDAGLAEPDGVAVTPINLWREELASFPTDRKVELAMELEKLTLAVDKRVRVDEASYADVLGEAAVATSTGIAVYGRESGCYLGVSTLADDGDETQTGWAYSVGRAPDELDSHKAAQQAAERATRLLGATKPSTRKVVAVFDPFVTAQFLAIVGGTLNGESVAKGRSPFAERLGDLVGATMLTLVDDPTNPLAYTATDVDGEGLAARRNVLVENGVLKQFVHSSYSARRAGVQSTGNAVRGGFKGAPGCGCLALSLVPGSRPQAELIASIDDGVLIQQVSGLHSGVNAVSGDFSTGAAGLLIRNGELAGPVKEFTIASTLQRMLADVREVGGDLEWLPMRAAGVSLVVDGLTLSGS